MNVSKETKLILLQYFSFPSRLSANKFLESLTDCEIEELLVLADYLLFYVDNPVSALPPATRNLSRKREDILSFIQSVVFLIRNSNWNKYKTNGIS